jgi:predicted AlkP superfamily phosphohydrolase/phosphomutase
MWQVLFTGVNVSEKGVYRRHDRKIIIVRWPITSNAQTNEQNLYFEKNSMLAFEQVHLS